MCKIVKNAIDTSVPNVSINPNVNIEDILALPEIPCQRDHKRRVSKMEKHFAKNTSSKHFFVVFNVKHDMDLELGEEKIECKQGVYLADGNTRAESKRQGKAYDPQHPVIVTIIHIDEPNKVTQEYYSYDSSDATENVGDKIRGGNKLLGLSLQSPIGLGAGYATALRNAYPGDSKDEVVEKQAYFKSEIQLLDSTMWSPKIPELRRQHLISACLIAAKRWSEPGENLDKITEVFRKLSQLEALKLNTSGEKWNGITALVHQLLYGGSDSSTNKGWYPIEYHNTTKFASVEPVISFLLYCFELEMNDRKLSRDNGFKESSWLKRKTKGEERDEKKSIYREYLDDLEEVHPTI
tara:strand:+ start:1265 stop:2320 length:1056 start_codon:yes stop_codon:yes gene_type:complete